MPEYLAPGVYVEETSFRSKSIEGVSTTTTGFIGPTRYGPFDRLPDVLTSLADFERVYGDRQPLTFDGVTVDNYMWHATRAFFENGGKRLYVVRLVADDAAIATGPVSAVAATPIATGETTRTTTFLFRAPAAERPIVPGSVRIVRQTAATTVTDEDSGQVVNGLVSTFRFMLAHPPDATNVTITWTVGANTHTQVIADTTTSGDGAVANTSLDRATGEVELDTGTALAPDGPITVSYQWDDDRTFVDNGSGQLAGQAGATGLAGTVDYASGAVQLLFATAPPAGQIWTIEYRVAAAEVTARFPGAAGNGTLTFTPRGGQHLPFAAGALPAAVAVNDVVEVLHSNWKSSEWRRVGGVAGAYTLGRLPGRAATTDKSGAAIADTVPVDASIIRLARANSVTVVWVRANQSEAAGIWEGIGPTPDLVQQYFSAEPESDERSRTLPVVIRSIADDTIHGGSITLTGGTDGTQPGGASYEGEEDPITDIKTGLKALEDVEDISIVAAPGLAGLTDDTSFQAGVLALQAHVDVHMRYRIAVIDSRQGQSISEVRQLRGLFDSTRMALYYPWVRVLDPVSGREMNLPPCGFVTGIYARNDVNRAVYKAPANEIVNLALGFEKTLNKAQQEVLNPEGVNCLRFFEGRGMRVWGARTMSSDPEWKYVNVRRYFIYLEHSIDRGTQWAVFEPNGSALWANIKRTIEDFLLNEFQSGALLGTKPEQAYFVRCDRTTMTQNDLDNGRLICHIGVAPLKPAEFVIFRIGQWTSDAKN